MAEGKQDTRGHLEMTPIYFYRHYESLFKEYLANRMAPVVVDVDPEKPLWSQEELWGIGISHVADVLKDFRDKIENTGYKFGSGRCMAYVPNSGNVASCLGELLLGRMDPYHDDLSKAIERSVIYFMCQSVGYPRGADGYVTSGGSTASVIAMAAARDVKKIQAKDYHKLVVYCTARTHTALDKALETVGLGMCHLREVEHDTEQRMIPEELERLIKEDKQNDLIPFVICGTIGTTDLGSIDPMPEIARIAQDHDIWFHVDGAIGGFYALCGQMRELYAGIEESDSMILDPHKSMSQPYGSGAVLFRKGTDKYVSCLKDEDGKVPIWQNSIENRMMFRTFPFWFSMNALGVRTFRTILERNLELAQYVYDQLIAIPELSVMVPQQCTVAFRRSGATMEEANANTLLLNEEMDEDERVCLSSTKIDDYDFIRICISNYRDHLSEINLCLDEIYTQLEDVLGRKIDRTVKPTKARLDWLKQVEKDLRWKEHDLGVRYLDRLIRIVFNEVVHEDVEKSRLEFDSLQDNLLYVSEEAVDPEKLLTISTAITLRDVHKKPCRFAGALGDFLAVMNNNVSGMQHCAPGAVELEHKIITHLTAGFGMDPASRGVLSPDICTANELAFIAARQDKFAYTTKPPEPREGKKGHKHKRKGRGRRFKKVKDTLHEEEEETHLDNTKFDKAVVYTTEEGVTLYANELTLIGLGECTKVAVASTRGIMDAADLEKKIQMDQKNDAKIPWLVIQPIDRYWEKGDIKPITDVCLKYEVWHHVAIGPKNASFLFELIKQTKEAPLQVHSASVDIQKSLSLSMGMAATMIKNHELLFKSMTNHRAPPYLPELPENIVYEPKTYSFELSRAHKATPLWFTLRLLGTKICCSEL